MTKLLAIELDALTGEVTERYLTAEETKLLVQKSEALQAEQDAKIAARQSALAKLAALGLTEEEIGAL
jgi:ATP-dependent protease HslVU (ClpYQ) ATPase subunit